ncbi:MAG: rhamnulose-1-phosphate aldolase [Bacilli bacterium]
MKENLLNSDFIQEIIHITTHMSKNGWHEKNSGNLSYRLADDEVNYYNLGQLSTGRIKKIDVDLKALKGQYFVVTGSGKYFKNMFKKPCLNLGIIKILENNKYEIIWGLEDGTNPTSELYTHLLLHIERQKINSNNRVVMHSHPTYLLAMTFIHDLNEIGFTKTLWKTCTEAIVVFPDGVKVLPWMLCGTKEIGLKTAEAIKKSRAVVWANHGIFVTGNDIDEAYGLIETIEKSANIYMLIKDSKTINEISDENLKELANYFKVNVEEKYFIKGENNEK